MNPVSYTHLDVYKRHIDDFSTGSLITRITNDITQIQNFAQMLLRGVFRSPVMLIGAIAMSFALRCV